MHQREGTWEFKFDVLMYIGDSRFLIDKPDLVIEHRRREVFQLVLVKIITTEIRGAELERLHMFAVGGGPDTFGQTFRGLAGCLHTAVYVKVGYDQVIRFKV